MPLSPSLALLLAISSSLPATGQNIDARLTGSSINSERSVTLDFSEAASFAADKSLSGVFQMPEVRKANAAPLDTVAVFLKQDATTLQDGHRLLRDSESILDLSVLKETSAYRNASRVKLKVSSAQAEGIENGLAEISAAYRKPSDNEDAADCESVTLSVAHRIKVDLSKVLEIVESEVSANPTCACEIVKIAIQASEADVALTADITVVAITAAPDYMRLISQCAIAAMPEALAAIQAVLAKYDPNSGDSSATAKGGSKSGKDAVESVVTPPEPPPNPLDLPTPFYIPVYFNPNQSPDIVTDPGPPESSRD